MAILPWQSQVDVSFNQFHPPSCAGRCVLQQPPCLQASRQWHNGSPWVGWSSRLTGANCLRGLRPFFIQSGSGSLGASGRPLLAVGGAISRGVGSSSFRFPLHGREACIPGPKTQPEGKNARPSFLTREWAVIRSINDMQILRSTSVSAPRRGGRRMELCFEG